VDTELGGLGDFGAGIAGDVGGVDEGSEGVDVSCGREGEGGGERRGLRTFA
jgi:hypothetical protein